MTPLFWTFLAFGPPAQVVDQPNGGRVRDIHVGAQARLGATSAWNAFRDGEGTGWTATWDEMSRTPLILRGPGLALVSSADSDTIGAAVLAWVESHRLLLGLGDDDDLAVSDVREWRRSDAWFVDISRSRGGIPVWNGGFTASLRGGKLAQLKSGATGSAPLRGTLALSEHLAVAIAHADGPTPGSVHEGVTARRLLVPVSDVTGLHLVPSWEVSSRTSSPPGSWHVRVHGQSGKILGVDNDVRFFNGTVSALHHARTPVDPLTETFIQEAWVEQDGLQQSTGEDGSFTLPDDALWSARLHGDWLDVDNTIDDDASGESDGDSLLFSAANAHPAEIDTWVAAQHMRDWGLRVDPDLLMSTYDLTATVNLPLTCNAYYDGNLNFYAAGGGCNNTGMLADVVYHEWGHGWHYWANPYGLFDGSVSEGAADVVAFLQTGDPLIAPYFQVNGGAIRNVAPDRIYPEDYVDSYYYTHDNGLIFGGAFWDLREMLIEELGETEAIDVVEQILTGTLKAGPTIETSYDDAVFADDDNGTLADGTPHLCTLIDAFSLHGLGPGASGVFLLAGHSPVEWGISDVATPLSVDLEQGIDCLSAEAETAWASYRVQGGEWVTVDLVVNGTDVTGALPALPDGSFVEYYLTITDPNGVEASAPTGGEINPYSFYVGDVIEVSCERFETGDGEYTHELLDGEDIEGADDWMWGAPQGEGGDPASAYSGTNVWGTDLALDENWDGQYQDGKKTKLVSMDLSTGPFTDVFLHYQRWLAVENGYYDDAVIRADGDIVWRNVDSGSDAEDANHVDNEWMGHAVPLDGAGDDGSVAIAFSLESDDGLHFGGWTIDDVCLYAPATGDNRLAITDFKAEADSSVTVLSWTNPTLAPLSSVVVVRRADRFPSGHDDGIVVYFDDEPDLARPITTGDPGLLGQGFYAVYASDGTTWLSWTVEGLNADDAVGTGIPGAQLPAGDPDAVPLSGSSCGCTHGGTTGAWLFALALVGVRRRRA